jgi:hypothetical protein
VFGELDTVDVTRELYAGWRAKEGIEAGEAEMDVDSLAVEALL